MRAGQAIVSPSDFTERNEAPLEDLEPGRTSPDFHLKGITVVGCPMRRDEGKAAGSRDTS